MIHREKTIYRDLRKGHQLLKKEARGDKFDSVASLKLV